MGGRARHAPGSCVTTPPHVRRLAAVVVVGAILSMLDATVVGVGLATIARDLDVGLADAQWIATSYLLALAAALPACGWLGRRIGVGRLWLGALTGFLVASALCAAAPGLGLLVAARVLQGVAAGLLVPAGQTLLGQAVGPERLGRLMATLAAAVGIGPAIGPVVGGVLVETLSWQWLFLVNLPIGLAGLVAGLRIVPRGVAEPTGPLDVAGLVLAGVGLSALVLGVTEWGARGGVATPTVWSPLVGGTAALALFVRRARSAAHPVTDLRLFFDARFAAAVACATLTGAAMFGGLLLLPLHLQLQRGHDVIGTGLALLGLGLGTAIAAPFAARVTERFGAGPVALAGAVAVAATTLPFALTVPGPFTEQVLLALRGIATGIAVVPPTVAAYAAVTRDRLPDAATQLNVMQRVGGAVGGAVVATVLAAALPAGTRDAFAWSFLWLTGMAVVAAAAALVLALVARRPVTTACTAG